MKKTFILAIAILSTALFMSCESSDVKEARQKVSEFVKAEKEKGLAQSPDRTGKFEDLVLKGGKLIFTNSFISYYWSSITCSCRNCVILVNNKTCYL